MADVEQVEPMFRGMQQIQNVKTYHLSQMQEMAAKGQTLKHDLDSLVRVPHKSHRDSLDIVIKYRQLEIIVENLNNN